MKLGYVGVPAPEVLEYDPWFGHPPETEKSIAIKEAKKLEEEHKELAVVEADRVHNPRTKVVPASAFGEVRTME